MRARTRGRALDHAFSHVLVEAMKIGEELQALVSIIGVCVCVGIPLWWKTTEVYRCPLPYREIEQLHPVPPNITYLIRIISLVSDSEALKSLQHVEQTLRQKVGSATVSSQLMYPVEILNLDSTHGASVISQLKQNPFQAPRDTSYDHAVGQYTIYLVPAGSLPCMESHNRVLYSRHRHAIIEYHHTDADLSTQVMAVVRKLSGNEALNTAILRTARQKYDKLDTAGLRQLRAAEGYQVTITMLVPDPSELDCTWNIEDATNNILVPFISSTGIARLGNFTLSSQVFYYSSTSLRPKWSRDESSYTVSVDQLPPLISSLEARLGSHVSQWPSLNFVVYIPKLSEIPLHIRDKKDSASSPSDTFLVPQWGGVVVYNHNGSRAVKHGVGPLAVDMIRVMPLFVQQLKLLLGLPAEDTDLNSKECLQLYPTIDHTSSAHWLEDQLMVVKMIESSSTAVSSLVSLVQLLDKVKNMVIGDHIQSQVEQALNELVTSYSLAERGVLESAYAHAKSAMLNAESAFYDPSILALLYFPDDQKFAIYIPLFLPIGIPMLINIVKRLKRLTRTPDNKPKAD